MMPKVILLVLLITLPIEVESTGQEARQARDDLRAAWASSGSSLTFQQWCSALLHSSNASSSSHGPSQSELFQRWRAQQTALLFFQPPLPPHPAPAHLLPPPPQLVPFPPPPHPDCWVPFVCLFACSLSRSFVCLILCFFFSGRLFVRWSASSGVSPVG